MDPDLIAMIAERKIQEAVDDGLFDDLPGKGKPLRLDEDSTAPAHVRMANKVLKKAGVLPEWLQLRKEIIEEREAAAAQRARLIAENELRHERIRRLPADSGAAQRYAAWHAANRAAYLQRLRIVNTAILKFTLAAPSTTIAFRQINVDIEMRSFDAEFPARISIASLEPPPGPPSEPPRSDMLKRVARARYRNGARGPSHPGRESSDWWRPKGERLPDAEQPCEDR